LTRLIAMDQRFEFHTCGKGTSAAQFCWRESRLECRFRADFVEKGLQ
jgi:hypothetical protein